MNVKETMLRVRFVGTDKFVGSGSVSYAFSCDNDPNPRKADDPWFVPEERAHVFKSLTVLRRVLSMGARDKDRKVGDPRFQHFMEFYDPNVKWNEVTWSRYEVVYIDGTSEPLDSAVA